MRSAISDRNNFFTEGFSFVDALRKNPPHESACWSCGDAPIIFFNVGKDCRSLGWYEAGMPEQIYVCQGCAPLYMNSFNIMLAQGDDETNVQI